MTPSEINRIINDWETEYLQPTSHKEHRKAAYELLRICVNHIDKDIEFYFMTEAIELRENYINRIVFANDKHDELGVIFKNESGEIDKKGELYLGFIVNWFLKRADLETVKDLIKHYSKSKFSKFLFLLIPTQKNVIINIILIVLPIFIVIMGNLLKLNFIPLFFNIHLTFSSGLEIIIILLSIIILGKIFSDANLVKLFIPRLLAGILVGYLPLITGDLFWKIGVISNLYFIIIPLVIISLTVSLIYITYEIRSFNISAKDICKRTINLFSRGVLYSFIVGIFLLDLFYRQYIYIAKEMKLCIVNNVTTLGLLGEVNPTLLLFFFPLALLIGIVIQFIWEEKSITHPLK